MATEKTDVVIVGVGAVGGILAAELGKAGMKVIGLERGPRLTTQDFARSTNCAISSARSCAPMPNGSPLLGGPAQKPMPSRCRF